MVLTNQDIKDATGITQSRLHRAQQRGVLKPQKPGRKGQGGGPEWSLANLGAVFIYEDLTSLGFSPDKLTMLLRRFQFQEAWESNPRRLATGELLFDFYDFPPWIHASNDKSFDSWDPTPPVDGDIFRIGRTVLSQDVHVTVAKVGLFAGAREVPEIVRFAEFLNIGHQHQAYAEAALGLVTDASSGIHFGYWFRSREEFDQSTGTEILRRFLGIAPDSPAAAELNREIEAGNAEQQLFESHHKLAESAAEELVRANAEVVREIEARDQRARAELGVDREIEATARELFESHHKTTERAKELARLEAEED